MRAMTITASPETLSVELPKAPVYAVGVIRVSEVGDRAARPRRTTTDRQRRALRTRRERRPEQFKSPIEQRERIEQTCRLEGLELAEVFTEMDISGRKPLDKRKGLLPALQAIEAGHAKVLIVAYFDRLVRNLKVQFEVIERVEAAGGRVLAVDFGQINTQVAVQWLSSVIVGAMAEYQSRSVGERLATTQKMAIADGLAIGSIPLGYSEDPESHRLVVHDAEATLVKEAFEMRAEGKSYNAIRNHLAAGGVVRGINSIRKMLKSRTYLGELFHGRHRNAASHAAIISPELFARVQAVAPGEQWQAVPDRQNDLLLSGLRILKCGECGRSLAVGAQVQSGKRYSYYRCNPNLGAKGDRRVSIDARTADLAVANYMRVFLSRLSETEGLGPELIEARAATERTQAALARATRIAMTGAGDEVEAQAILSELRAAHDRAVAREMELERAAREIGNAVVLNAGTNWDDLTFEEQREMVSAVLRRVVVTRAGLDASGRRLPRGRERTLHFVTVLDEVGEPRV
jgi:site-specific DNA recombinase